MQFNHLVETRSVYIHWPFCPYKCHFCPFVALAGQDQFMARYHAALCTEIRKQGATYAQRPVLDTIYMGGGTPSTYPDELLLDMFGTLKEVYEISQDTEVTIEVNPGTVRAEQLGVWKQAGINRLSIGVQSLKDPVLKNLNRHQKAEDVFEVIERAHTVIGNLSVDLIIGLPEVTEADWKDLLSTMVKQPITHISIYFLTVHEGTALYFRVKKQDVVLPCDDGIVDLYYWSKDFLASQGFMQYEISNFARAGYESRHNRMYWERKPFAAFGIGACSFDGAVRYQNEKDLMQYINALEAGESVTAYSEQLSDEQVFVERVMLGIRQSRGVVVNDLLIDRSEEQKTRFGEQLAWLQEHGFVTETDGRIALTPIGLSVENNIALRLTR